MIIFSKVPAFGFETSFTSVKSFSDSASKTRHNAQKIIGYLPGLSIVQGFEHLAQACKSRKFSPYFILRGLLEVACLGFLLVIPDLIVTAIRRKQLSTATATMQGRMVKPLAIPTKPLSLPAMPPVSDPILEPLPSIDWSPIKEKCKQVLHGKGFNVKWLEGCLKFNKIESKQPGVKENLQALALEIVQESDSLVLISYMLQQKIISRSHPQDLDFLKKFGLILTQHRNARELLNYLELNPNKPGCLQAIQDIACASAKKFGYLPPPCHLDASIPAHQEVLCAILKEASQNNAFATLKLAPSTYKIPEIEKQIEAWAVVSGSVEERQAKALEMAQKPNTGIAASLKYFGFDATVPVERTALKEIAKAAFKNNFSFTLQYFKNFGFDPKQSHDFSVIKEIFVGAALEAAIQLPKLIDAFSLSVDNPVHFAFLEDIALEAAQQNSFLFTHNYLDHFPFTLSTPEHRETLFTIGKTAAFNNPHKTLSALNKYALRDQAFFFALENHIKNVYRGPLEKRKQIALKCIQQNTKDFSKNAHSYFSASIPEELAILKELAVIIYKKKGIIALAHLGLQHQEQGIEFIKEIILAAGFEPIDTWSLHNIVHKLDKVLGIHPQNPEHADFFRSMILGSTTNLELFWNNIHHLSYDLSDNEVLAAVQASARLAIPFYKISNKTFFNTFAFDHNDPNQEAVYQEMKMAIEEQAFIKDSQYDQIPFTELLEKLKTSAKMGQLGHDKCVHLLAGYSSSFNITEQKALTDLLITLASEKSFPHHLLLLFKNKLSAEARAQIAIAMAHENNKIGVAILSYLNFDLKNPVEQKLLAEVLKAYAPTHGYLFPETIYNFKIPDSVKFECLLDAVKEFPAAVLASVDTKHLVFPTLKMAAQKHGSWDERKKQALAEAKQKPDHCAENIKYYGFIPTIPEDKQVLGEIATEALTHNIANVDRLSLYGLHTNSEPDRKVVQAALLKAYQHDIETQHFSQIKGLIHTWIHMHKPEDLACLSKLLTLLAAKNIINFYVYFKDYNLDLHNPLHKKILVEALEAAYQSNPDQTILMFKGFPLSLADKTDLLNTLQTTYPKACGTLEERQSNALKTLAHLSVKNLNYFFDLPKEKALLDDFAVQAIIKTKKPELLFQLGHTAEQDATKVKSLLVKACETSVFETLQSVYSFIKKHKELNQIAFVRDVLLAGTKTYFQQVIQELPQFQLNPAIDEERQILQEIGVIAAQFNGGLVKDKIGLFGFNKQDKKQKEALRIVLREAVKEDGPNPIDPLITGDPATYKGAKFIKSFQ